MMRAVPMRAATDTRPATVDRIREIFKAHPGAKVRTHRGPDGRMQVSIVAPDPLTDWKRRHHLRFLKARAEAARATIGDQP